MSKRKNRSSSPNLPADSLARAREQIAQPSDESAAPVVDTPAPAPAPRAAALAPRVRKASLQPARSTGAREKDTDRMDTQYVRSRLEHPTRVVSEAELRRQYGYVVADLRQMAILSVGLVVLLLVLGRVL
jgi:hypothetical protein